MREAINSAGLYRRGIDRVTNTILQVSEKERGIIMNMKNVVFWIITILTSIFFIDNAIGEAMEAKGVTDNSIKIGVILDQTGPATGVTIPITQAMRTYARHVNDHGGVHERKLKMCVEDDRYSIPPALAAFKKLAYRDRVFTLMGPSSASLISSSVI